MKINKCNCGGEGKIYTTKVCDGGIEYGFKCSNVYCIESRVTYRTKKQAIASWNAVMGKEQISQVGKTISPDVRKVLAWAVNDIHKYYYNSHTNNIDGEYFECSICGAKSDTLDKLRDEHKDDCILTIAEKLFKQGGK